MLHFANIRNKPEKILSLTSLTEKEFDYLFIAFEEVWSYQMQYFNFDGSKRQRTYREKSNAILKLVEDKLFFILYYLKNNPLQEALAENFGMTQPQANVCIHYYKNLLHKTLSKLSCLAEREVSHLKSKLSNDEDLEFYCDGTERAIPRSTDWETQKENYSGKKHCHSKKNNVITNNKCEILYLSNTYEGSVHDKKITDEEKIALADKSKLFVDTGFQGIEVDGDSQIMIATKKPRKKELSEEKKNLNTLLSRIRVRVEHAIGGVKRLRIVKDKVRTRKDNFRDMLMEMACGLHNFRLKFRPWKYPKSEKILQT